MKIIYEKGKPMRIFALTLLCCAFIFTGASNSNAQKKAKSDTFRTEGTFSSITVGEGGDYGGMQVYLTDADGQFYATVTIAEGVLLPPVLVKADANVKTREIAFTLPGEGGGRKFKGKVTADGMTLDENGQELFLKRTCLN